MLHNFPAYGLGIYPKDKISQVHKGVCIRLSNIALFKIKNLESICPWTRDYGTFIKYKIIQHLEMRLDLHIDRGRSPRYIAMGLQNNRYKMTPVT